MKVKKNQDTAAQAIRFGVEIETMVPLSAQVDVGGYHNGAPVVGGYSASGEYVEAPMFDGARWRADRDGSIRCDSGYIPCEFVSPILYGDEGLSALRQFIAWANRIGAKVNASCGCHITIGIKSVIGTSDAAATAEFVRKLAHIAHHNAWAIYAQTGTGRHQNHYCHQLRLETEAIVERMTRTADPMQLAALAGQCGRGIVNFQKAFNGGDRGAVEFRAFAGTLNEAKVLHHLATAFGIMRRAATVKQFGRFDRKSTKKHSKVANAVEAVRRLWRLLGWVDSTPGRDCALGLFGALHAEFGAYRKTAMEMAEKFEARFPAANL